MIILQHHHYLHEGGTKDYDLFLLSSVDTSKSVLIKRYGKVKSAGQVLVEIVEKEKGYNKFEYENKKRKDRKYFVSGRSKSTKNVVFQELENILGHTVFDRSKTHLETVFLTADVFDHAVDEETLREQNQEPVQQPEEWGTW